MVAKFLPVATGLQLGLRQVAAYIRPDTLTCAVDSWASVQLTPYADQRRWP
ncbi:MAG TPA: hypothetical protein VEX15_08615 [Nocardioidaceae bacterium]|nr:hypothetical protein [Nocardioidaceae bacterium]